MNMTSLLNDTISDSFVESRMLKKSMLRTKEFLVTKKSTSASKKKSLNKEQNIFISVIENNDLQNFAQKSTKTNVFASIVTTKKIILLKIDSFEKESLIMRSQETVSTKANVAYQELLTRINSATKKLHAIKNVKIRIFLRE